MEHLKITKIVGLIISWIVLVSTASAARQMHGFSSMPTRPVSRPMSRPVAHPYSPHVSSAPRRNVPNAAYNKNAALEKRTTLNRNTLSKNSALNKSLASSKSLALNQKTTVNRNLALAKNTALKKNIATQNVATNKSGMLPRKPINPPNPNIPTLHKPSAFGNIPGSQNWKGPMYAPFKNYRPVWQSKFWWTHHYDNIVFVSGGWYALEEGYWIPAWGYDTEAVYYYDGPIYACSCAVPPNPCDVVANVQTALQAGGYYEGEIDGVLSPDTQAALSAFQEAQDLEVTGAVDEPTLESLGLT